MRKGMLGGLGGLAILAILAVLALGACGGSSPKERAAAVPAVPAVPARPARAVHTAAVETAGGGETTVPAMVAARRTASLASRFAAAVRELPKREGEAVAAGAVVVRLDDGALRSGLAAAEAANQAAETDRARFEGLAQRGAATAREVEEVTARAAATRAALQAVRENLSYAVLKSPFAGRIAARRVEVGDIVSPGVPLVEIEGVGGLEIHATLAAEESRSLRPGATVEVQVDGISAGSSSGIPAKVTSLSPAGDPATHRFELRADLPANPGLRSGLFARLILKASAADGQSAEAALVIPAAAVFARGGLTGVFVAGPPDANLARLRWIALGRSLAGPAGGKVEVRSGLAAGERVIVDPGDLADGDPITGETAGTQEPKP